MVLPQQISALLDYLESRKELALGHLNRTCEGRSLATRLWGQCADILNAVSADCPQKSGLEWRTFFTGFKSRLLRKVKILRQERNATGGGPKSKLKLSPHQERLLDIIGRDVGEPLPGIQHALPTLTLHDMPAAVNTSASLSIIENIGIPPSPPCPATPPIPFSQNIPPGPPSPLCPPNQPPPNPSTVTLGASQVEPPRIRRRRTRVIGNAEQRYSNLNAAQERMQQMVNRHIEALDHHSKALDHNTEAQKVVAQANTYLADAILKLADKLGT